jgi:hypothetical protein
MRRAVAAAVISGLIVIGTAGSALANPTGPVTQPGQHGQDCGALGTVPGGGNSSKSPGSPFYGGNAGSNYAGQKPQNSRNGQNSQYDVACFQQSVHH